MNIRKFEVMCAGDGLFPTSEDILQKLDGLFPRLGWTIESITELDVNDVNTTWDVIDEE